MAFIIIMETKDKKFSQDAAAEMHVGQEMRKLRKKIRKAMKKRSEEIDEIKRESVRKYFRSNQKAQLIIDGTDKLSLNFLTKDGEMIQSGEKPAQETQPSNNETTRVLNEGISQYWKKVLAVEYGEQFLQADQQLLEYLQEISVSQYTKYKLSLSFRFREGHPIVDAGVYWRTLLKDEDGTAVEYSGNSVPNYDSMESSFMKIIMVSDTVDTYMESLGQLFDLLCCQIIPKSLNYYLKYRIKYGLLMS